MKTLDDPGTEKPPLVSCLCITRNNVNYLKRAVNCFINQTYPNKELLIVYEEGNHQTSAYLKSLNQKHIRHIEVPSYPKLTLGELRNLSIKACYGEYFCQWDDDDWYHNDRLSFQMTEMLNNGKEASVLAYKIMFNMVTNQGYISGTGPWPGTILCKTSLFGDRLFYPTLAKHEDTSFLNKLVLMNKVFPIIKPSLYIYVYHGNNTFESEHFDKLYITAQPLSKETSTMLKKILTNDIACDIASQILLNEDTLNEFDYMYYLSVILGAEQHELSVN